MDIFVLYDSTEICISPQMLFNCLAHERNKNNEHEIIDLNYYFLAELKYPESRVFCFLSKFNQEKRWFSIITKSLSATEILVEL